MMQNKNFQQSILEWLHEENAITKENNVYHAPNAFIANSVMLWCYRRVKEKTITQRKVDRYLKAVRMFLQNKLTINWEGDKVIITKRNSVEYKSITKKEGKT